VPTSVDGGIYISFATHTIMDGVSVGFLGSMFTVVLLMRTSLLQIQAIEMRWTSMGVQLIYIMAEA
jgi:hypothetical protein